MHSFRNITFPQIHISEATLFKFFRVSLHQRPLYHQAHFLSRACLEHTMAFIWWVWNAALSDCTWKLRLAPKPGQVSSSVCRHHSCDLRYVTAYFIPSFWTLIFIFIKIIHTHSLKSHTVFPHAHRRKFLLPRSNSSQFLCLHHHMALVQVGLSVFFPVCAFLRPNFPCLIRTPVLLV